MGAANDITRKHCLLHECRIASMPRRPPSPHVLLTRRPRRRERLPCATLRSCRMPFHIPRLARASLHACGVRRCGPHCWVAPQCPKMHAPRSTFANRSSDSPPETSRFVAARRRPTSCSPATRGAARGRPARRCKLAARHATSRSSRASPSGLAACDDGARTVAPRRNVHRRLCRAPHAQIVILIFRWQRLAAHTPAGAPRLARPSPTAPRALLRAALSSCRAAMSTDAGAACPSRRHLFPILRRQRLAAGSSTLAPRFAHPWAAAPRGAPRATL